MGLYDEPLPDLPEPTGKGGPFDRINKNNPQFDPAPSSDFDDEDEDEDEYLSATDLPRLFSFDDRGVEVNKLLPSLGRRLDTGIGCYFEPGDRKVVNLVEKTGCHPEDAAWALEAHRGDVTEAWTSIGTARRNSLNEGVALPGEDETRGTDWDAELRALMSGEEDKQEEVIRPLGQEGDGLANRRDEIRKKRMLDNAKDEVFDWTQQTEWGPNDQWLPGKANSKPVDDEPWFTG